MLRIFKETKINFIGFQKWAIGFSLFLTLVTFVSIGYHWVVHKAPFNWSIEFVGGTQVQLKFNKPIHNEIQRVRDVMNQLGFAGSEIKPIGTEADNELLIIVRKQGEAAAVGKDIQDALTKAMIIPLLFFATKESARKSVVRCSAMPCGQCSCLSSAS
jgi:preprotein translocase subunit SecF